MTLTQRLALRASEIRQRLNEIAGLEGEALTDEIRQESDRLTNEYRDVETRQRAATVAESGNDSDPEPGAGESAETRERRELRERSSVGAIFAAAVERGIPEGATRELQEELGLGVHQVPLELLRLPVEARAVTPGPTNTGASEQPTVQPVFATGDAAFLGVDMPSVAAGDAVFPVLTSRPTVGGPHTDSTAVAETTGAFEAEVLKPSRLQASFFYRRTDAARFAGMDAALRQALSEGLSEANDAQVIAQIVADVGRTDAAAADDFASYQKRLIYDRIDGRFATMEGDMRHLVGAETLGDMATLYKSAESPENFPAFLRRTGGGVRVSAHIAAAAASKQDVIVRRGTRRDMVAPVWEGVTIIPDEVTKAGTGEIVITAVALSARKVIRAAGFARIQAQFK